MSDAKPVNDPRPIKADASLTKSNTDHDNSPFIHCWCCYQYTPRGICNLCGVDTAKPAESGQHLIAQDPFLKIRRQFVPSVAAATQTIKMPFIHWHIWEHIVLISSASKWALIASMVGILTGSASALFLTLLTTATSFRIAHPWLLWLLPLCGLVIGFVYHKWGQSVEKGTNLILDRIHEHGDVIPILMAPLILIATVLTHLFGGSAGREGTAVQIGGSLGGWLAHRLKLSKRDTRIVLMSGMSAGFGAVFGTPLAGAIFGMEVQSVGRMRYEGLIPCLVGSIVGDLACRWWGVGHTHYPTALSVPFNLVLFGKLALAGIIFGLAALLFSELTHAIADIFRARVSWPPLRPFIGGLMIIAMTYLVGSQDYLGLSLPLLSEATENGQILTYAFALKLIFTAVTLGTGFKGGEVTPLFVIGATLGHALGNILGAPPALFAMIGFVAVFGAAANTPLACLLMGIELFGGAIALPYGVACMLAYIFSGHRGIYLAQRIEVPKATLLPVINGETLREARARTGQPMMANDGVKSTNGEIDK